MNHSKWKIINASVIGTSHIERNIECQDRKDHKVLNSENGEVLVAVLSDGAGSSDYSQFGAEMACSLFIREIEKQVKENGNLENLNYEFGLIWLDYFRQQITELAEEQFRQIRDYACTLLAAVVWNDGAVFYQVGDGGIICSPTGETESYYFAITPIKKIYANATNFITDEDSGKHLLFEKSEDTIEDLVMFTDGIEPIAVNFQNQTPHEPFLIPMLAPLRRSEVVGEDLNEKLKSFLGSPRINEKTDDDKTLLLASRAIYTNTKQETIDTPKPIEITAIPSQFQISDDDETILELGEPFFEITDGEINVKEIDDRDEIEINNVETKINSAN